MFFLGGGLYKLIFVFIKDASNESKVLIKTFIMLQKISISDKCCSSELYSSKKPEKIMLSFF